MRLLTLSLGCGLLILFILLTRRTLARRLPKRVITVLWAVCALRLIIPFSLELPVLASEESVCAAESAEVIIPAGRGDDIVDIAVTIALCAFTKPVVKEQEEIVRTTVRREPDVTCKETYVKDFNDHMRRRHGYTMLNNRDITQWWDEEKSGKYVYPEDFYYLNAEGKYYLDGKEYNVSSDEAEDYIIKKHQLETAYNMQLGNSVSLQTSDKLLSGLKAGQKVHVVTDIDLENTVIPEKYKWTDPITGITYTDESGSELPRWLLRLLKKSNDGDSYEYVSDTGKRDIDVNVTFEIPEDGDYIVQLMNASEGSLLNIISTDIEIIK